MNKDDLAQQREIDDTQLAAVAGEHRVYHTSAKTGAGVDSAFEYLANAMLPA